MYTSKTGEAIHKSRVNSIMLLGVSWTSTVLLAGWAKSLSMEQATSNCTAVVLPELSDEGEVVFVQVSVHSSHKGCVTQQQASLSSTSGNYQLGTKLPPTIHEELAHTELLCTMTSCGS